MNPSHSPPATRLSASPASATPPSARIRCASHNLSSMWLARRRRILSHGMRRISTFGIGQSDDDLGNTTLLVTFAAGTNANASPDLVDYTPISLVTLRSLRARTMTHLPRSPINTVLCRPRRGRMHRFCSRRGGGASGGGRGRRGKRKHARRLGWVGCVRPGAASSSALAIRPAAAAAAGT